MPRYLPSSGRATCSARSTSELFESRCRPISRRIRRRALRVRARRVLATALRESAKDCVYSRARDAVGDLRDRVVAAQRPSTPRTVHDPVRA